MSPTHEQAEIALAPLRDLLGADGYDLQMVAATPEGITLQIAAQEGACADCLVPANLMTLYVRDALKDLPGGAEVPIELRYPQQHDRNG